MRHQIPLVVQPRGMLSHWAIRHKRWKKALAMKAFQRSDLEGATLFFATSHQECDDIRALGFSQPIAVIPNGVVMPICSSRQFETQGGLRKALFLSRIHPTKGLGNLVEAWARLRPAGWQLIIAGPDEGGHRREVALAAHRLGVSDAIQWVGEIDGDKKSELYRSADFFVLPTFSENFGVVVAEALAHGLPVITTRGAPWADLDTYDCGWWIDVGVEPLVNALRSAIALSDEQLREMGARGREYVRRYDWEDIARRTTEVYWWILGQGRRPDCVRLD